MPNLSIITICLNAPKLEQTCQSVIGQRFQDFEWVFIDGGSNADVLNITEKYRTRMDYFVSEKDNGLFDAMNKGVLQSHGEWLLFLNAGDSLVDSKVLQSAARYLDTYASCDILYGNNLVDRNGRVWFTPAPKQNELNKLFFYNSSINHQSSFIKRDLLIATPYDTQYKMASDWLFTLKMYVENKRFQYVDLTIGFTDSLGISSDQQLRAKERSELQAQYFTATEAKEALKIAREHTSCMLRKNLSAKPSPL